MRFTYLSFFLMVAQASRGQADHDSITISRFLIREELYGANWKDTLRSGHFANYISDETKAWDRSFRYIKVPALLTLLSAIKSNGTADVAKCFIPRHSINYYKNGKIVKYLLVCFECDGLRFSDDPGRTFVKSAKTRSKQMAELKEIFTGKN